MTDLENELDALTRKYEAIGKHLLDCISLLLSQRELLQRKISGLEELNKGLKKEMKASKISKRSRMLSLSDAIANGAGSATKELFGSTILQRTKKIIRPF